MLKKLSVLILLALGTNLSLTGCLSSADKLALLPEANGDQSFIVGWQPDTSDISGKEAHRRLDRSYNKAATAAAAEMGWTLKKRVLTNASNLSTTFDPARYRSASAYSIQAPDLGCRIAIAENERITANCSIMVVTGGLEQQETPEGVSIPTGTAWGFDEGMRHQITVKANDDRSLPIVRFAEALSAALPAAVFLYIPENGGIWMRSGTALD